MVDVNSSQGRFEMTVLRLCTHHWSGVLFAAALGCLFAAVTRGQECVLETVTCGKFVTVSTETEICGVIELAEIGKLKDKVYAKVTFFVGVRLGGEVLFLGGGSAKSGMIVQCKLPLTEEKTPDYEILKKNLPLLLAADPKIKEKYPNITAVKFDESEEKKIKFEKVELNEKDKQRIREAEPLFSPYLPGKI
jgi:hypothetical protein